MSHDLWAIKVMLSANLVVGLLTALHVLDIHLAVDPPDALGRCWAWVRAGVRRRFKKLV